MGLESLQDFKLTKVQNATAAGTTDVTSSSVDMRDYDAVLFFTTFGTITASAVTSVKVQQSSDDGSSDTFADLTGTAITVEDDDDNEIFGVEIINPVERYLRFVVDRATQNAVVGEIYALQYRAGTKPITNTVTDAATFESHVSPAEGTA